MPTDVLQAIHDWFPILYPALFTLVGWLAKTVSNYRTKDRTDRETLKGLTEQVAAMKRDLDALKAGNVAEYQESISESHTRYVAHGMPLTIASRGRVNAMMRSLSALDDTDGTYQSMVDDINDLPIFQPHEG